MQGTSSTKEGAGVGWRQGMDGGRAGMEGCCRQLPASGGPPWLGLGCPAPQDQGPQAPCDTRDPRRWGRGEFGGGGA